MDIIKDPYSHLQFYGKANKNVLFIYLTHLDQVNLPQIKSTATTKETTKAVSNPKNNSNNLRSYRVNQIKVNNIVGNSFLLQKIGESILSNSKSIK